MSEFVCPKCGRADRLREQVVAYGYADVSVEVRDGRPSLVRGPLVEEHDVHSDGDVECDCGARFTDEDDLRVITEDWRPGDAAVLPDGLRGYVETVGPRLTVVGWHEEFEPRELSPVLPIFRSERLAA